MVTTKQVNPKAPNPTGKGGFQDRPEDRSDGRWNKNDSISYQYNKMVRMSPEELKEFVPETVAQQIAKQRVTEMLEDNNATKGGALQVTKEVTDRIEGKAQQMVDVISSDGTMTPSVRIIDERINK